MKRSLRLIYILIGLTLAIVYGCSKPEPAAPPQEQQEQVLPDGGDEPDPEPEPDPDKDPDPDPEPDPDPDPDQDQEEDTGETGDDSGESSGPVVLDPGQSPQEHFYIPQHPELEHEVSYSEFYDPFEDWLDEFGNIDYVVSQANGTAWPIITSEGRIRLYQGSSASKGGSYFKVRSHNGAKLLSVSVGSATPTKIAYSLNGKMAKSSVSVLEAGDRLTVDENCSEICFWCMGTTQGERWELDYVSVKYQGGFIESDYYESPVEYGPLMQVEYPFSENFESGFPTTDKPSYYKYGLTAGRDNLNWSTWYGSFSWQNPIEGSQSAQLRVYQEDEDYNQPQFGHLQMEFFLKDLVSVSFKYYMSEFWLRATVSYCEFGDTEWKNPCQIALDSYSQRQTVRDFRYVLDEGRAHDAKIRIVIDESTGFPSRDHYDFITDCFVFDNE